MKKILTLLISCAMILSMSACGKSKSPTAQKSNEADFEKTAEFPSQELTETPIEETLKKDENGNVLNKITIDFVNENSEPLDVELLDEKQSDDDITVTTLTDYSFTGTSVSFYIPKETNTSFPVKYNNDVQFWITLSTDGGNATYGLYKYIIDTSTGQSTFENVIDKPLE